MEKILRFYDSHNDAEQAARTDDDKLTCQERFDVFMKLMAPFYAAPAGFQRVYRIDDFRKRTVYDDWDQLDATELRAWLDRESHNSGPE